MRFMVCLVAVMVLTVLVGACAEPAPTTQAPTSPAPAAPAPTTPEPTQVVELSAGEWSTKPGPGLKLKEAWHKWLEKASGGRLKVAIYGDLAAGPDLYDAARTGIADIASAIYMMIPDRLPISEVVMLPLLFEEPSWRQIAMTCASLYEKYPEIRADHPDVKVLYYGGGSISHICSTEKYGPIHTLDDLKGMQELELGPWAVKTMKTLGTTPVTMDPSEYYDALAKGVVDGTNTNFSALKKFGEIEVIGYIAESGLTADAHVYVMNMKTWNSLPPDLQKIFEDSYWIMTELTGFVADKDELLCRDWDNEQLKARGLPEAYKLPAEEKAKWVEAALPVREMWVEKVTPTIGEDRARAILNDVVMLADQYRYETTPTDELEQTLVDWGTSIDELFSN
jgi:TRAP-type C4-dicarboxylate transport system substrate-binding protein